MSEEVKQSCSGVMKFAHLFLSGMSKHSEHSVGIRLSDNDYKWKLHSFAYLSDVRRSKTQEANGELRLCEFCIAFFLVEFLTITVVPVNVRPNAELGREVQMFKFKMALIVDLMWRGYKQLGLNEENLL